MRASVGFCVTLCPSLHHTHISRGRYVYVNIDDCWPEKERDAEGRVVPDQKRFPSGFKALADYVHQHGMLLGFYTAMGSGTCAGYPALNCTGRPGDDCAQARRDVAQYVAYGIDSLKIDGCQGMVPEHFNVSWSFPSPRPPTALSQLVSRR